MAEMRIEDPELVDTKKVDSSGKLYLGKDYAGKRIRYIIESVEEEEE